MNALNEASVVRALYKASQAGVSIDLIIRGVCILRPGVPKLSENIKVRSIVGRFLEHTRIFYFENGGDARVFCASADWMNRNLHQRVETCFPILDETLRERVIREGLQPYLADNMQSWELHADGRYVRLRDVDRDDNQSRISAQSHLLKELGGLSAANVIRDELGTRLWPSLQA